MTLTKVTTPVVLLLLLAGCGAGGESEEATAQANAQSREFFAARGAFVEENGLEQGAAEVDAFEESWFAEHPRTYAEFADVADHIDHVGIGYDFDGVGDSLPTGLKDVSQYPNLIVELLERGYSAPEVRKILSGNLLRVWGAVEKLAAEATGDDA